jgi:hypothetical protein
MGSPSTKVVNLITCPWPKCGYTWEPRGPNPPKFCAKPTCKRPMVGPHTRTKHLMTPAQRVKIAIGHLKQAEVMTSEEAFTFLRRAGLSDGEVNNYLRAIDFSP